MLSCFFKTSIQSIFFCWFFLMPFYSNDNQECKAHHHSRDNPQSSGSICIPWWEKCSFSKGKAPWNKVLLLRWHGLTRGIVRCRFTSSLHLCRVQDITFFLLLFFVASETSSGAPHQTQAPVYWWSQSPCWNRQTSQEPEVSLHMWRLALSLISCWIQTFFFLPFDSFFFVLLF